MYDKWMRYFQKKVFWLEDKKYKLLDKFFPNWHKKTEKNLNKRYNAMLKKAETEEQRQKLIAAYKQELLDTRKEKYQKINRNYHFDKDNPEKTIAWLNWNKAIHQKGLRSNIIYLTGFITSLVLGVTDVFPTYSPLLIAASSVGITIEGVNTFINTNCILLQDYNIKRIQRYIEGPYQKRQTKIQQKADKYHEATSIVSKSIKESETLPTIDQIVSQIKTPEQGRLLLELINGKSPKQENTAEENITTSQNKRA